MPFVDTVFQRGCMSTNLCVNFASFFANISEGTNGHLGCRPRRAFTRPTGVVVRALNLAVSSSLSVSSLLLSLIALAVIH